MKTNTLSTELGSESRSRLSMIDATLHYKNPQISTVRVLEKANLSVLPDEIVCLVGESGSGKTTVLNLLAGLMEQTEGRVVQNGAVVSYLQQEDLLLPFRTVWQNACLAAELRQVLSNTVINECASLLQLMRLDAFLPMLPSQLSGGMKRRVALARQLVIPSNTFLLDEPFASQDRAMRQVLEDLVHQHCRRDNKAAIIVTHDLDGAVALADRILVLGSSKRFDGEWKCPEELLALSPSARRNHSNFPGYVAEVWRIFWEVTEGA